MRLTTSLGLAVLLLQTGCSALGGRTPRHGVFFAYNYYVGTQADYWFITNSLGPNAWVIPFYLIDLPFSFVLDTVLLPLDYYAAPGTDRSQEEYLQKQREFYRRQD